MSQRSLNRVGAWTDLLWTTRYFLFLNASSGEIEYCNEIENLNWRLKLPCYWLETNRGKGHNNHDGREGGGSSILDPDPHHCLYLSALVTGAPIQEYFIIRRKMQNIWRKNNIQTSPLSNLVFSMYGLNREDYIIQNNGLLWPHLYHLAQETTSNFAIRFPSRVFHVASSKLYIHWKIKLCVNIVAFVLLLIISVVRSNNRLTPLISKQRKRHRQCDS